ncbi:MAG: acyloxyacyl hydrolase [Flavobacteriales bacterium]
MRKLVLTSILSAFTLTLGAQQASVGQPEAGCKLMGGFLVAHHIEMQYLTRSHAWAAEVYYEKPVTGKKYWHWLYRRPEIGYTFLFVSPGNPEEIGYGLAAIPYIKFHPVYREHFRFNIRSGMGVGYLSNFFNRVDNNKNVAIGSHTNIVFNVCFEPEWRLGKWDLGIGISFVHYSNGAWKVPNLGYNIPMIHLNVGKRFGQHIERKIRVRVMEHQPEPDYFMWKKWTFQLALNGGVKEILPVGGPKYGVFCFAATALMRHSPMSSFLFSSETYYNNAYHAALERFYETKINGGQAIRSGVAVGYGLNVGKLLIYLQNGIYAYSAYRSFDGSFFHRLGARYVFDSGLMLHAGLKTHFAKADNFELGIGYCWGKAKTENK